MSDKTGIEWSDATWNPVVGCSKVSPGCDNCYAITQAHRIVRMSDARDAKTPYQGTVLDDGSDWTGTVKCLPERLDQPLRWKRPRRVFVDSMSDLFHPDVPDQFIASVFAVMSAARQHQFQILTKRPKRMAQKVTCWGSTWVAGVIEPLPNVWAGTSIENDRYTFRADHLRDTPAAVRWISAEPLLGPLPSLDLTGIDWLVVGGESGPNARPMHPAWVRDLRDRAVAAGVALFFKQWGGWRWAREVNDAGFERGLTDEEQAQLERSSVTGLTPDGRIVASASAPPYPVGVEWMMRTTKHAADRVLDGRTWDEYPT